MQNLLISIIILTALFLFGAECEECGECPQFTPMHPDACKDGVVFNQNPDECGCRGPPTCLDMKKEITGVLEKYIHPAAGMEMCGYCITIEGGDYTCKLIKTSDIKNIETYVGKKVTIKAKVNTDAVTIMCPYQIVADSIELVEDQI